jgi:hypothetical protein
MGAGGSNIAERFQNNAVFTPLLLTRQAATTYVTRLA